MMMAIPGMAQQKTAKTTDDDGVAQAIRFEKTKAAADARQAKLEAEHPCGCASTADVAAAADKKPVSQRASNKPPKK